MSTQFLTNQKECTTAAAAFDVIFSMEYFQLIYPTFKIPGGMLSTNFSMDLGEKFLLHDFKGHFIKIFDWCRAAGSWYSYHPTSPSLG